MESTCPREELRHSCIPQFQQHQRLLPVERARTIPRNVDLHRLNRMGEGNVVAESRSPYEGKVRVCSCNSCQRTQYPLHCSNRLSTGDRDYDSAVGTGHVACFNWRKDHPATSCCRAMYNAADAFGTASGVERLCVMCSSVKCSQQSSQTSNVNCVLTPPSELRSEDHNIQNVGSAAKRASDLATRALGKQIRVYNWYLVRPRGAHISEVAVGGFVSMGAEEKQRIETAPIIERLERCTLLAKDGVIVRLVRLIDDCTTISNGFSPEVANIFVSGFPYIWNLLVGNGPLLNSAGGVAYRRVPGNCDLNGGETGSPTSFQMGVNIENNEQPFAKEELVALPLGNNQREEKDTAQSRKDGVQMEADNVLIEAPCAIILPEIITLRGLPTTDMGRDARLRNDKEGMQEMVQSTQHRCDASEKLVSNWCAEGLPNNQSSFGEVSHEADLFLSSNNSALESKGVDLFPAGVLVHHMPCLETGLGTVSDGRKKRVEVSHLTRSKSKSARKLVNESGVVNKNSEVKVTRLELAENISTRVQTVAHPAGTESEGKTVKVTGQDKEQHASCKRSVVNKSNDVKVTRLEVAENISARVQTVADPARTESERKRVKVTGQDKEQHASCKKSMLPPPLPRPRVVVSKRLVATAFGLKTSRSGRLLVPPLAHWRSQTLVHDMDGGIIAILNGTEDNSNLNPGCFNFKPPVEDGARRLQKRLCAAATECLSNSKRACRSKRKNFKHLSR